MTNEVLKKADLLSENRNLIHKGFIWDHYLLHIVAASAFAGTNVTADVAKMKACKKILKSKKSIFSYFRGNTELLITSKMALSENPEKYLDDVSMIYDKFQSGKFFGSTYRVLAAVTICDSGRVAEADAIVAKTEEILKGMKASHPFITTDEDTALVVLLAMTNKSVDTILYELEETFKIIKTRFSFTDNTAYSLCQVITTYEGAFETKCDKIFELYNEMKNNGAKYGRGYEFATLGTLLAVKKNPGTIAAEVAEVADYLKKKKGFGAFYLSKANRLMYATMVVSEAYSEDTANVDASVIGGTIALVIAQQIAIIVCISATCAANTATT